MQPITLVKLGGSVITDKNTPYSVNTAQISQLASELATYDKPLIVSHGSGSFGHTSATKFGGKKGYSSKSGIAKLCFDASWINHLVMQEFTMHSLPTISLRPLSLITAHEGQLQTHQFRIVESVLRQGLIPVVFGDVIIDTAWNTTIFSGERVISEIATFLQTQGYVIDKVIQVGITDGFYTKSKKTVPVITPVSWENEKQHLFQTSTNDVTGGMEHKIEEALSLTTAGITTYLINGLKKNELVNALHDKSTTGTIIQPQFPIQPIEAEYVVLVDEINRPIGRAAKLAAHTGSTKRHRGFSVFLFNQKKQLLLQQRSKTKKTWPLVWSNSCCGHPKEDELPEDAAKRRLEFELGIKKSEITMLLPDYKYTCEKDGIVENEFCPVMVAVSTEKPHPNPAEVEAIKWISWEDWVKEVISNPQNYSQWCVEETQLLHASTQFHQFLTQA